MQEAKYANADDSALGSYDVFGTETGYKGVDVSKDLAAFVAVDEGIKLAKDGEKVAFKKKKKKKRKRGGGGGGED